MTATPASVCGELVVAAAPRSQGSVTLRPKPEAFAQAYVAHGNASRAYREVFDCQGTMRPNVIRQRAYELVHEPRVAARIRQLYDQAAKDTTISARVRMVRLQEICEADSAEIVRVVTEPCSMCWADDLVMASAADRALAKLAPWPDLNAPRDDCPACRGHGASRMVLTPTDQLSPAARRLLKAVRQKSDGSIEVVMHDQLQATDMLNKMQGVYVDRSVSINANVNVPPPDVSAESVLNLWKETRDVC